jgi:actin related protein 2/3 complex subunit 3
MPGYHSKIEEPERCIAKMAILSFRTKFRGPINIVLDSHLVEGQKQDIIDEAFFYFKANVFFKSYEINSNSDRLLIYLTLYIVECLKRVQNSKSRDEAVHEMYSLAISRFDIPSDPGFPLNSVYGKPLDTEEADYLRQYMTQIRQECGLRLAEKLFEAGPGKPSKWWLCFAKRKFMNISLSGHS